MAVFTNSSDSALVLLTEVPLAALAQPLIDFLRASGLPAYVFADDSGLDSTRAARVLVGREDEERAKELLADYWAANEAPGDEM